MSNLQSIFFALVLCLSSAGLIAWHVRAWKRIQQSDIDQRERNFRHRQYRRRMQTSAMLGLLGVAIFVGQLLMTLATSQLFLVIYWCCVLALLLWMAILAVADMAATSFYYSREKNTYIAEHAKLQGELLRAREEEARRRNGKPSPDL
jgi:UDP-N-acetylmuramyl pentapeptide phosphotransferase/UDP-N-acetylglucosamine-1-phosphate transferase